MPANAPPTDPRPMARLPGETGVMPIVRLPRSGMPTWAIATIAIAAAILLFVVLDARRRSAEMPLPSGRTADSAAAPAPPPLLVPRPLPVPQAVPVAPPAVAPAPVVPAQPQVVYVPQPAPTPATDIPPQPQQPQPQRVASESALVFDAGASAAAPDAAAGGEAAAPIAAGTGATVGARARAGMFANRSTTVPQGTLIPAVLETALDSTRPGFARAIVQRDIRGFDGTRVLIPRGSRLIGEYRSEAAPGQRRALVNWVRLIRPDGVTMAIGSPAGDPLGRGGIRARVNTHFFERFAGAILQSALDVAVNLAGRSGDGAVVVLPGTLQNGATAQIVQPPQVTPTLKVRQGTSISIFVSRDLDFTGVENR